MTSRTYACVKAAAGGKINRLRLKRAIAGGADGERLGVEAHRALHVPRFELLYQCDRDVCGDFTR
jgi:hypothetical protein